MTTAKNEAFMGHNGKMVIYWRDEPLVGRGTGGGMSRYLAGGENSPPPSPSRENPVYYSNYNTTLRTRSAASLVLPNGNFVSNLLLRLQWNLSKADTYGTSFCPL